MHLFLALGLVAILAAVLLYLLTPVIKRLMTSIKVADFVSTVSQGEFGQGLFANYFYMALFSSVVAIFFILPIYFHEYLAYSMMTATSLATIFIVGRLGGLLFSKSAFGKLAIFIQSRVSHISVERLMLSLSGVGVFVTLWLLSYQPNMGISALLLFCFGFFTSLIIPLNISILNSLTYKLNHAKHASLQRIAQNAGLAIMFIVFIVSDRFMH